MESSTYIITLNNDAQVTVTAANWMVAGPAAIKKYLEENPDYDGPQLTIKDVAPDGPAHDLISWE